MMYLNCFFFPTCSAYGNAVQDDLWRALEEEVEIEGVILPATIKQIMDTWTLKKNYPLITVTRDYGDSDGALVTQVIITSSRLQ